MAGTLAGGGLVENAGGQAGGLGADVHDQHGRPLVVSGETGSARGKGKGGGARLQPDNPTGSRSQSFSVRGGRGKGGNSGKGKFQEQRGFARFGEQEQEYPKGQKKYTCIFSLLLTTIVV